MTEDRRFTAIFQRPNKAAPSGFGLSRYSILVFFICLLSSVICPLSAAEGISVNKAEMRLNEDGYQLSASYDIKLTFAAQQALTRGVTLYFVGDFLLTRSRWYWLDEKIFQGEQTVKLSYNVLTRQYRLSRGTLFQNFASFEDALNILSRQSSAIIPAELIKKDSSYIVETRLRLDVTHLPLPLQVNAMAGKDWTLDSEWYRWMVRPAEITLRGDSKVE